MRRIWWATLPGGHFWSYGPSWTSMNLTPVLSRLTKLGHLPVAVEVTSLLDQEVQPDDLVIYTSSENPEVRQYIKDVMYILQSTCRIIPSYEALLAHENKGFQQLYRNKLGFGCLSGGYGFDLNLIRRQRPFVYKPISGAGSSGVELIQAPEDIARIARAKYSRGFGRKIVDAYRWITLPKESFVKYRRRKAKYTAAVWQQFVPDLDCDYKVLVFGERLYVLRRGVKEKDFRASGSGRFSFVAPPHSVLDFASNIHERLASPYSSLDIVTPVDGAPALIEYQCVSFGPYAVVHSPGYFVRSSGDWIYKEQRTSLEDAVGHAVEHFISCLDDPVLSPNSTGDLEA